MKDAVTTRAFVTKENFDGYYETHYPEICRFCGRMLGKCTHAEDLAKDLAQEAFVKAYLNLEKFDLGIASFRTWIFRIARNVCLDEMKRPEGVPFEEDVASGIDPPEESQDIRRMVNECFDRLNDNDKPPFELYHLEGFTYEEIARIIQTSLSTARNRVKSAESKMKVCLKKKGAEKYISTCD